MILKPAFPFSKANTISSVPFDGAVAVIASLVLQKLALGMFRGGAACNTVTSRPFLRLGERHTEEE